MDKLQAIKNSPVYQEILKDSMGGVLYNVANRDKYDTAELLEQWNSLAGQEKESADGIVTGAMNFIQGR